MIVYKTPLYKYWGEFKELEAFLGWLKTENILVTDRFDTVISFLSVFNVDNREGILSKDVTVKDFDRLQVEFKDLREYLQHLDDFDLEVAYNRNLDMLPAIDMLLSQYLLLDGEYIFYPGYTEQELRDALSEIKKKGTAKGVKIRGVSVEPSYFDIYERPIRVSNYRMTQDVIMHFEKILRKYFKKPIDKNHL